MRSTRYPGVYSYEVKGGRRYACTYRDSRGRQSFKRGFASPLAASKAKAALDTRARQGELVVSRITYAEWFARWLAARKPYLEESTYRDYAVNGRLRLVPRFGEVRLNRIDAPSVAAWIADLVEEGKLGAKTINNAVGILSVSLNAAVREGLIPYNPAAHVQRLPPEHREMDYLRRDEIPRYLRAASPIYRPLATLLLATGARVSEALALNWGDVEWDLGLIRIYRSAKGEGVGSTKADNFRRVAVGDHLLSVLRDLRATQSEQAEADLMFERVFRFKIDRPGARGLWGDDWRPMHRNTVSSEWHPATLKEAGLRSMPLHSLRHTAAAFWLAQGQDLVYVQRQLGHRDYQTTVKTYAHLETTYLRDSAAQLDFAMFGRQPSSELESLEGA